MPYGITDICEALKVRYELRSLKFNIRLCTNHKTFYSLLNKISNVQFYVIAIIKYGST